MPARILIADDDPVVRHLLSSVLRAQGYPVQAATSGSECLELIAAGTAANELPAVIFVDLQLNDMTGADVVEELLKRCPANPPAIVMVSSNSEDEVRAMYPQLVESVQRYLEKPFPPDRVLSVVRSLVDGE